MAKCTACGKFIAAKDCASCCKCTKKYHLNNCAQLPESAKVKTDWRCLKCRVNSNSASPVKDVSSNDCEVSPSSPGTVFEDAADDVGDTQSSQDNPLTSKLDIGQELRMLRAELREKMDELKEEFLEFRREMSEIRQDVVACNKRVDTLESRLEILETRNMAAAPEEVVEQLENTVAQLKLELNDREQELLLSDLEIGNLPKEKGENILHTVELVAKKLGMTLQGCELVFAERVSPRLDRSKEASVAGGAIPAGEAGSAVRGQQVI